MTIRPEFNIQNEEYAAEDPGQFRLLIEVGACSLIFVLLNVRGMRPAVIRVFQWPQVDTREPESILRGILENDAVLSRFKASEVFLVYNFPESNLVPEKYFSADMTRPVTDLIYGNLSQNLVLDEKIPWFEFHNVYRVPARIHFLMQEKFQEARYWHFYSLQLKCYKMFTAKEEAAFMKVFFYPDKMVLMVSRSGQLQLIQHFNYQDSKDVLYNLLNCCHQLNLSREELVLELSGMIERKSALYEDLELYFLNIRFESMDDSIRLTDELMQFPNHFFSSLLKMAICV
ncbi:MAG TPA: hypothetical protein DIC22_05055 [Chitinophagaceae bacterium]|jgi:hypothetical protein|nr:hypothetical protein [Chitinophagaceae bacterium]